MTAKRNSVGSLSSKNPHMGTEQNGHEEEQCLRLCHPNHLSHKHLHGLQKDHHGRFHCCCGGEQNQHKTSAYKSYMGSKLAADPGGPAGPGPPCPQDFKKSCNFQAILWEKPYFEQILGSGPPLGSKLRWPPLTKILDPRLWTHQD